MASSAFTAALRATKESKNIETMLSGSSYLDEGIHDVTIQAVDTSAMDDNKLKIAYIAADGKGFSDNSMFMMDQDGKSFAYGLRALWAALIPDTDALEKLLDLAIDDDKAFEMLTGMKLRITLKYGKGVQARATDTGKFAGFDMETNDRITEEYDTVKEVYTEVKGRALKRSYLRIVKTEATNVEFNLAAFNLAYAARTGTAGADSGVISADFKAG